jgi:hypothetical protein
LEGRGARGQGLTTAERALPNSAPATRPPVRQRQSVAAEDKPDRSPVLAGELGPRLGGHPAAEVPRAKVLGWVG